MNIGKTVLLMISISLFIKESWATVYTEHAQIPWRNSDTEKTTEYSLNQTYLSFTKGRTRSSLETLKVSLEQNSRNSSGFTVLLGKRLISCVVDPRDLSHLQRNPGQCVFAQQENTLSHYQIVQMSGLPRLESSEALNLAGIQIHAVPHFKLQAQNLKPFQLVSFKDLPKNSLSSWQEMWRAQGWKLIENPSSSLTYLAQGHHTILTRQANAFTYVFIQGAGHE